MPPGEHVHIISAGEKIHTVFPAILRTVPGITRVYVVADSESCSISANPQVEKERVAVRHAAESVKEIAASLGLPYARELVFPPLFPSARTVLTKIRQENPKARITFDLSAGPRDLCLALFALAPWVGGEVFASLGEKVPRNIPLPDRSIRDMMTNPNYQTILAVLLRKNKDAKGEAGLSWFSRSYLFSQVWPLYIRSRARKPKEGDPVIQYRKGRKPANNLSQATFSSFIANLRNNGLVEERQDEANRKEKAYRITEFGETAFWFYADPDTGTSVKTILESL
jgi:hypothetical protein